MERVGETAQVQVLSLPKSLCVSQDVFNETRSILEPAGAVSVAGAKAWLKKNNHKVRRISHSCVRIF